MMRYHPIRLLPLCCAMLSASPAYAVEWDAGGFYSLTVASSSPNDDLHRYAPYGDQDRPLSATDLLADSKAGLMLSAEINARWRFSSQWVLRRGASHEDPIQARLAYLEYRPDATSTVKLGRTVQGLLLNEEAIFTDYANLAVRPAQEPYALTSKTMIDGLSFSQTAQLHDLTAHMRASVGQITYYSQQFQRKVRDSAGISVDIQHGGLLLHAGLRSLRVGLFNSPATRVATEWVRGVAIEQGRDDVAREYDISNLKVRQYALGGEYKSAPWTAVAEILWTQSNFRPNPRSTGWNTSLGYAVNNVTPYVAYGRFIYVSPQEDRIALLDRNSAIAIATANYLARATSGTQATLSVGIRWDLAPKTALKLQWDRIERPAGLQGWFVAPQHSSALGPDADNQTNVWSLSLQGVF